MTIYFLYFVHLSFSVPYIWSHTTTFLSCTFRQNECKWTLYHVHLVYFYHVQIDKMYKQTAIFCFKISCCLQRIAKAERALLTLFKVTNTVSQITGHSQQSDSSSAQQRAALLGFRFSFSQLHYSPPPITFFGKYSQKVCLVVGWQQCVKVGSNSLRFGIVQMQGDHSLQKLVVTRLSYFGVKTLQLWLSCLNFLAQVDTLG